MKTIERLFLPLSLIKSLQRQFDVAGLKINLSKLLIWSIIIDSLISLVILILFRDLFQYYKGVNVLISFISYLAITFFFVFVLFAFLFYGYITYKKVKRRNEIEDVLSDYLELVAANVGAGMTIDQALWYAIRDKFGVLAYEMETVAKKIMAGDDMEKAVYEFTDKYDSPILKKSFVLLIESIESGGEIASLISKIAWSVKENQIMKKEIAGNVTMYTMFIMFASVIAAPLLYSLSHRIIIIMSDLTQKIDLSSVTSVSTKLPIQTIGQGISATDFKIFAYIMLFVTSLFSGMIISIVKKGSIKEGLKNIPYYIIASISLFLLFSVILTSLFSNIGI
ncbi:type II secretion system F family protein [Candidatus Woesearchaeota archaeon]|nr:type II secretion system F family protein [Candidatus Woesearchaeota archaeon]